MYLDYIKDKYGIKEIYKLSGGYSFDEKYHFYNNGHFTLKIYNIDEKESVLRRLELMDKHFKSGIRCPEVISFGEVEDKCYSIVTFIEGDTGDLITNYTSDIQYDIGLESGKDLKLMHTFEYDNSIDIYEFHVQKFDKIYKEIKSLSLSIEKEEMIVDFIRSNLYLLKDRPSKLLHGDFHLENSVFNEKGYVGCFDYNRVKFTDPLRDFERICVFSRELSMPYCKGIFDGYEFKLEDFKILKLYLAMGLFNSKLWTHKFYPDDSLYNDKLTKMVLDDFSDFNSDLPKWYK